ncbi:hypothetical protein KI387_037401, partial [Taxus chinensis]
YKEEVLNPNKKNTEKDKLPRNIPNVSSALFFKHNTALGPPYQVLVDTNFINFSIQNKLDLEKAMMDCLYAKCTPCITDCVMAELEKLGQKYRVALRIAKDPRFDRLPCTHKGTYADDCLVERVTQHKCYIVATCDRDLKRRIRKIPGVPIMYITQHKYSIERLPEATMGGGSLGLMRFDFAIQQQHVSQGRKHVGIMQLSIMPILGMENGIYPMTGVRNNRSQGLMRFDFAIQQQHVSQGRKHVGIMQLSIMPILGMENGIYPMIGELSVLRVLLTRGTKEEGRRTLNFSVARNWCGVGHRIGPELAIEERKSGSRELTRILA